MRLPTINNRAGISLVLPLASVVVARPIVPGRALGQMRQMHATGNTSVVHRRADVPSYGQVTTSCPYTQPGYQYTQDDYLAFAQASKVDACSCSDVNQKNEDALRAKSWWGSADCFNARIIVTTDMGCNATDSDVNQYLGHLCSMAQGTCLAVPYGWFNIVVGLVGTLFVVFGKVKLRQIISGADETNDTDDAEDQPSAGWRVLQILLIMVAVAAMAVSLFQSLQPVCQDSIFRWSNIGSFVSSSFTMLTNAFVWGLERRRKRFALAGYLVYTAGDLIIAIVGVSYIVTVQSFQSDFRPGTFVTYMVIVVGSSCAIIAVIFYQSCCGRRRLGGRRLSWWLIPDILVAEARIAILVMMLAATNTARYSGLRPSWVYLVAGSLSTAIGAGMSVAKILVLITTMMADGISLHFTLLGCKGYRKLARKRGVVNGDNYPPTPLFPAAPPPTPLTDFDLEAQYYSPPPRYPPQVFYNGPPSYRSGYSDYYSTYSDPQSAYSDYHWPNRDYPYAV